MDEESLQASIDTYKSQLQQVDAALKAAGTENNDDLVKLRADLGELIQLTEESLLSYKKSKLLARLESTVQNDQGAVTPSTGHHGISADNDRDVEFLAFQAAINEGTSSTSDRPQGASSDRPQGVSLDRPRGASIDTGSRSDSDDEPGSSDTGEIDLGAISGTKCRVPHSHEWGEKQHCNALILGVESLESDDTPKVRVLFCNPTHRSMLPCPYFLEGNCRFNDDDCRYSHGHVIPAEDLQDFEDPDYSCLAMESACLVKDSDGVWYKAMVIGLLDDHKYEVMFDHSHDVHTVDMEDILPLDDPTAEVDDDEGDAFTEGDSSGEGDEEGEEGGEDEALPVYLWKPSDRTDILGEWEVHTKGIGSKLMARMGYVMGQGLGRRSDGRAEPVPIQLLPQGKSLDRIMALKARAGDRDLYDVMNKEKKNRDTETGSTKKSSKNVFDFINKKLGRKKGDLAGLVKQPQVPLRKVTKVDHITTGELKKRSDKHIHIQMFKTHGEMKNVEKEIKQLKTALGRNKGSDHRVAKQIQGKIASAEQYLKQLQMSERSMTDHQKAKSDRRKLTVF